MKMNFRLRWMRCLRKHDDLVGWEELTYEHRAPLEARVLELVKDSEVRLIQIENLTHV